MVHAHMQTVFSLVFGLFCFSVKNQKIEIVCAPDFWQQASSQAGQGSGGLQSSQF